VVQHDGGGEVRDSNFCNIAQSRRSRRLAGCRERRRFQELQTGSLFSCRSDASFANMVLEDSLCEDEYNSRTGYDIYVVDQDASLPIGRPGGSISAHCPWHGRILWGFRHVLFVPPDSLSGSRSNQLTIDRLTSLPPLV